MYFYFSSSFPSAIKIGGIYFGTLHINPKFIDIDISKSVLIEVVSLNTMYESINFILDENFEQIQNGNICITDLKGGYLLHFTSQPIVKDFSVIAQQKYSDCVITVFTENGYKLSIETPNDFFACQFDFCIANAEITRLKNNLLTIRYQAEKNILQVFDVKNKITCLLQTDYSTCELNDTIKTTNNFKDIEKHTVTSVWKYDGKKIYESEHNVAKIHANNSLISKIIPFAFCEEMIVNGDISEYLAGNVLENKDKLKTFFGDFIGIMPPPIFRDICEVGFIYKKNPLRFYVEYFIFELDNNKIINITQK